jgi:hypothetical protein
MTEPMTCQSKDLLVTYLYEECGPDERRAVEAHLADCAECRAEANGLSDVRSSLSAWEAPPMPVHVRVVTEAAPAPRRIRPRGWLALPLAAAAVLVLAAAAALANLEIQYGQQGLVVRTGWSSGPATTAVPSAAPTSGATTAALPVAAPATTPWRGDLKALEERLRQEILSARRTVEPSTAPVAVASRGSDADLLKRVQQIVDESELRQQRNLALRMAEVSRDFSLQRQADLVQIQQGFGRLEGRTEAEAAKQRELMQYIMRVSQPQPPK